MTRSPTLERRIPTQVKAWLLLSALLIGIYLIAVFFYIDGRCHTLRHGNTFAKESALADLQLMDRRFVTDMFDWYIAWSIARYCRTDPSETVRTRAELVLSGLETPSAIDGLKWFAENDPSELNRIEATASVGGRSKSDEREFLQRQTKDSSRSVRLTAFRWLAELGDDSGLSLARSVIGEKFDPSDKRLAIEVLGAAARSEDLPLLQKLRTSPDPHPGRGNRLSALRAYEHSSLMQLPIEKRLPFLIASLDDQSANVRDWAYTELYGCPDPNTDNQLRRYLSKRGPGDTEAANALTARAWTPLHSATRRAAWYRPPRVATRE